MWGGVCTDVEEVPENRDLFTHQNQEIDIMRSSFETFLILTSATIPAKEQETTMRGYFRI